MKGALWTLSSNVFGKYAVAGNYLLLGLQRPYFLLPFVRVQISPGTDKKPFHLSG